MSAPATSPAGPGTRVNGKARVATLYFALTLLLAYPLSLHPASMASPGDSDTDLFMWTLAWNTHALTTRPLSIFDANIFHPNRNTLAYSENLIGSTIFAAPVLWLTGNPVLALNVVELLSVVLCGLGAYVLARRLGVGAAGAVLCGLIFAFAPSRLLRLGQAHLTTVQWVPFCLASLHAYLDEGKKGHLRLAVFWFALQATTSGHGAVFLAVSILALAFYRVAMGEPLAVTKRIRDLGVPGALLIALVALLFVPYRHAQIEMDLRRTLGDGATPQSFLASPTHLHVWLLSFFPDARIIERATTFLFPGYLPILLAAVALVWRGPGTRTDSPAAPGSVWTRRLAFLLEIAAIAAVAVGVAVIITGPIRLRYGSILLLSARSAPRALIIGALAIGLRMVLLRRAPFSPPARMRRTLDRLRRWREARRRDVITFYGILTLLAVWLAVPGPLGLWSRVYWMPGLNFIRAPSRFMILATLGLAVLAGFGFERLLARQKTGRRVTAAVLAGALLVAEFTGIPFYSRPYRVEIPGVDRWLDARPKPFVVAELPVWQWDYWRLHSTYMLHSTAHWQKTVHGYSGLLPGLHGQLYWDMQACPDEKSLRSLADLGVGYLVVHTDYYRPGEWAEAEKRFKDFGGWLTLEYEEGAGRVYALRPPPAGAAR